MNILFAINDINDIKHGMSGINLYTKEALHEAGHHVDDIFRDTFILFKRENKFIRSILFLFFPIIILPVIALLSIKKRYAAIIISSGDGFLFGLLKKIFFKKEPLFIMQSFGLEYLFWKQTILEKHINPATRIGLRQIFFMPFIRFFEVRMSITLSDGIFTLNAKEKKYIENHFSVKGKVHFIYPGLDDKYLTPKDIARDRELLFVGPWVPLKGVQYLVKIFLRLLNKYKSLNLTVIGAGTKEEIILKDFPEYARKFVRVIRVLPQQNLPEEYSRHRIFLFPSLYEGFGRVTLEAMALKMAVCVSESLGVAEIITHGFNGFLAPPRNIDKFTELAEQLLDDEELCRRLGENAFNTVKKMRWKETAKNITDAIHAIGNRG